MSRWSAEDTIALREMRQIIEKYLQHQDQLNDQSNDHKVAADIHSSESNNESTHVQSTLSHDGKVDGINIRQTQLASTSDTSVNKDENVADFVTKSYPINTSEINEIRESSKLNETALPRENRTRTSSLADCSNLSDGKSLSELKITDDRIYGELDPLPFPEVVGDRKLLRFLHAHNRKVSKAVDAYMKFLVWRKENNVDVVRQDIVYGKANSPFRFPHGEKIISLAPQIVMTALATDRKNQPIIVERYDFNPKHFTENVTINDYLLFLTYCMEYRQLMLEQLSDLYERKYIAEHTQEEIENGPPYGVLMKVCTIRDFKGVSLAFFGQDGRNLVSSALKLGIPNYPDTLGVAYHLNVPWIFKTAWSFIKGFLEENTIRKIQIYGSDYLHVLEEAISMENLPDVMGGTFKSYNESFAFDRSKYGPLWYEGAPDDSQLLDDDVLEFLPSPVSSVKLLRSASIDLGPSPLQSSPSQRRFTLAECTISDDDFGSPPVDEKSATIEYILRLEDSIAVEKASAKLTDKEPTSGHHSTIKRMFGLGNVWHHGKSRDNTPERLRQTAAGSSSPSLSKQPDHHRMNHFKDMLRLRSRSADGSDERTRRALSPSSSSATKNLRNIFKAIHVHKQAVEATSIHSDEEFGHHASGSITSSEGMNSAIAMLNTEDVDAVSIDSLVHSDVPVVLAVEAVGSTVTATNVQPYINGHKKSLLYYIVELLVDDDYEYLFVSISVMLVAIFYIQVTI